jgi:hypothetical protein
MGLACLKGACWWSGDPVCLWIAGLAGFRGKVLAKIMQACADLSVWPVEIMCVWIAGLAGLKSSSGGDPVGLRGGSLG